MGSYVAYGPKFYAKALENLRAFSCLFDPIYLESSLQCPYGVGLHQRRHHLLENKPWKEKLHHQESALDKKIREEASMEEENERDRERKKWHENEGKIGREVEL